MRRVDATGRALGDVYRHVAERTVRLLALNMGVWTWEPGSIQHLGETCLPGELCEVVESAVDGKTPAGLSLAR